MADEVRTGLPRNNADTGMMAPSFPSERKRVKNAEDRSPDLRLLQPPSRTQAALAGLQWSLRGSFAVSEFPWPKSCLGPMIVL
jgi:hypothetical protein